MRRVALLFTALSAAAAPPPATILAFDPALLREELSAGTYGESPGESGLEAIDLGDPTPGLLVGAAGSWYLLRRDAALAGWEMSRHVEVCSGLSSVLRAVVAGRFDGGSAWQVATIDGRQVLRVHDLQSGAILSEQSLGAFLVLDVVAADLEPGGGDELAVLHPGGLSVFRAGTSTPLWELAFSGGRDLAVGDVDTDPALELLVAVDSAPGMVVDAATRAVEWSYAAGFRYGVAAGDLDGDGVDEIVTQNASSGLHAFDGVAQAVLWSVMEWPDLWIVADADQDGLAEVVSAEDSGANIFLRDGGSGAVRAVVPNPADRVEGMVVGDLDGDCDPDLFWSASGGSPYHGRLSVADLSAGRIDWSNLPTRGPAHAFLAADIDVDGRTELVREPLAYDGELGALLVTDLHHRRDEHRPAGMLTDRSRARGLAFAQLDGDPPLEIVAPTGRGEKVSAIDGLDLTRQWTSAEFLDEDVNSLLAQDLDGDGAPEVLVSTSGSSSTYVRVLRGSDGGLLWTSPFGFVHDNLRAMDVDRDGTTEFLYAERGDVVVHDGVTFAEEWRLTGGAFLEAGDVDGDGMQEVLSGSLGTLRAHSAETRALLWSVPVATMSLYAARVADVDGDGANEVVVTGDDGVATVSRLHVLRGSDGAVLWSSGALCGQAGSGSSLQVVDDDDDGRLEIAVSTDQAVRRFEYAGPPADTTPPFWPAGAGVAGARPLLEAPCCPAVELWWQAANDDRSPPLVYHVQREVTAGFLPSAANRVATTGFAAWRDSGLAVDTTYYYVVRAVDAAGNEDANLVEQAVRTTAGDVTPGRQGNVLRAWRDGGDVVLDYSAATAGRWRLHRDVAKESLGVTILAADVAVQQYVDGGAVAPPGIFYYVLRGLSPCSATPGPI